jgi:hypothetical protein
MPTVRSMPPDEALKILLEMQKEEHPDEEGQHGEADDILCAVLRHTGHGEVADAWEAASKRWWWA